MMPTLTSMSLWSGDSTICSKVISFLTMLELKFDKSKVEGEPISILHFNDIYNIQEKEKEPVGGAARFVTKLKSYHHLNPLVFFSGDAFAPSICKS
jgi:hypothetical protein